MSWPLYGGTGPRTWSKYWHWPWKNKILEFLTIFLAQNEFHQKSTYQILSKQVISSEVLAETFCSQSKSTTILEKLKQIFPLFILYFYRLIIHDELVWNFKVLAERFYESWKVCIYCYLHLSNWKFKLKWNNFKIQGQLGI